MITLYEVTYFVAVLHELLKARTCWIKYLNKIQPFGMWLSAQLSNLRRLYLNKIQPVRIWLSCELSNLLGLVIIICIIIYAVVWEQSPIPSIRSMIEHFFKIYWNQFCYFNKKIHELITNTELLNLLFVFGALLLCQILDKII